MDNKCIYCTIMMVIAFIIGLGFVGVAILNLNLILMLIGLVCMIGSLVSYTIKYLPDN